MDSRILLKKLNEETRQFLTAPDLQSTHLEFLTRIGQFCIETKNDAFGKLFGDLWGACGEEGTGLQQQLTYAQFKQVGRQHSHPSTDKSKANDSSSIVHANFFGKQTIDIADPSYVQQVITFNEDAVPGQDTTEIFSSIFGPDNVFDSPTESKIWRSLNTAFHQYLFAIPRINKQMPTMHEIVNDYLHEIEKFDGKIDDIKDFSARLTMDMIGKTQLGLIDFPLETKRLFTEVVDHAIKKIANPKMAFPTVAKKMIEQFDKYIKKSPTLDEVLAPGFAMLANLIDINADNILSTPNWIRDVSIKKK